MVMKKYIAAISKTIIQSVIGIKVINFEANRIHACHRVLLYFFPNIERKESSPGNLIKRNYIDRIK